MLHSLKPIFHFSSPLQEHQLLEGRDPLGPPYQSQAAWWAVCGLVVSKSC